MRMVKIILSIALATLLAGCASGYSTFYRPMDGATPEAIATLRAAPPPAIPLVERAAPAEPDVVFSAYAKRGFAAIGHSMFNSGRSESEAAAVKQGQAVGADLVLVLNPQYTGTVTANIPITTPTSTTSYTSGSATAFGPAGSVTAFGNSTTTTYGTQTTNMAVPIHRSDYGAVYFVKQKFQLGAFVRDLENAERQAIQSNQGVVVHTIVDGTPAFHADILPGDIILSMDGERVPNQERFGPMTRARAGQEVEISLLRNNAPVVKRVRLAPF